ncbi:MAG: 2-furoate---CoA ligase [Gaiellales bacterium]|nr:2-furoate---CoA ligase [Gaiellales bacterium]
MNLAEHLLACAERHPEALAIVDGEQRATYADLLERARAAAGGLSALGVAPGDRVAAALKNRIEAAVLYWASQWLGAVFVPLNWRLRPDELTYCVSDCGARVLAIEGASAEAAEAVPGTPLIAIADATAGEPLAAAEGPAEPSRADEREPALMLYTSGTTGRPKGVPRSHRAERSAALAQLVQLELRPGDRTLGVMPLYHTMGMRSLLAASACGGVFCSQPEFRAGAALDAVERERLTSLYLAPTLFHDMVAEQRERPRDVSSVRALAYAGAPMTGVLVERCVEAFAPDSFVNHYGSTEIYTFTIHRDQRAKPGCAGRPALNARIRIVEPVPGASPDELVAPGEVGQVACALSSDEAFAGYWKRPDADARQIKDGWYFPGDLGQLDADGDLYLVGRIDDMIVSGGENVHPLEIEEWLVRHPGVEEAAVVGEEDERLGQRVVAYVVCAAEVTPDALDAHCLASPTLARFKRPRDYRFVDALPKSASGKLLRRLLRTTEGTT